MLMKFVLPFAMIATLLLSCATDDKKENTDTSATETTVTQPGGEALPAGTTSAGNINPPHGEPGHRCEIPVGAPLDGSPATPGEANDVINFNPPAPAAPTSPIQVNAPDKVATPAGTNPPHGEPGHDCNIPVGAPLNK